MNVQTHEVTLVSVREQPEFAAAAIAYFQQSWPEILPEMYADAIKAGFAKLYLCTDTVNLYERYGFEYLAQGWHPWGETSRIYQCPLQAIQA